MLDGAASPFLAWLAYSRQLVMLQLGGEIDQVQRQYEQVIRLLQHTRSSRVAAMAESDWGHRLRQEGRLEEALAIYRRMLVEWRRLGHRAAMANILENIAFVDCVQDRPQRAAALLGAAERIRELIGQDMLRPEREQYERELAALQKSLAPAELESFWAKGRAMPTDAVIALALNQPRV
jgi:hypothetical protein